MHLTNIRNKKKVKIQYRSLSQTYILLSGNHIEVVD